MALDEAPPFWWRRPGWQAIVLWPIGYLYGRAAGARLKLGSSEAVEVPVICVGNFIVGGGGKTPTVQRLCKHLKSSGWNPGVLSRGHGGAATVPTVVDYEKHNAHDVGDEALLHAENHLTVVAADRPKGADLLIEQGCNIIVMDDGFQNPSLHKDYSLVVVDSKRGLGNGFPMPAGPMRIPLRDQIGKADSVLLIGDGSAGLKVVRKVARMAKPVFHAGTRIVGKIGLKGKTVLAFAGIADPSKFFDTLEAAKVIIKDRQVFGDHHLFSDEECGDLIDRAKRNELELVTTAKDHARLLRMGRAQTDLAKLCKVINIELVPEDPAMMARIEAVALRRFEDRKLKQSTGKPIRSG
ncbi:MAG: tetraacyldisaccharide 4'-kinase [Pseudomonadota bacterium]